MKIYTEQEYAFVAEVLTNHDISVPANIRILKNIKAIAREVENGNSYQAIIDKYELNIAVTSFVTIFKRTTGVGIKEVALLTAKDKLINKLVSSGMSLEEATEILKD